ncbi:Por secretion system C-terminal sorting domain-containing protein [Fibrobacter sp. UWH9]|nr:Por secretion system C-terminal sorting domain-containing protein [Fibrobacter sp. UWH9]
MRFPKYGIWIMKKIVLGAMLVASTASFAANGDAYTWPTYRSDLDYDTKSNLGEIAPPTEFNNNCSGVTGKKAGKWWAIYWGKDRDSRITDVTIDSILKKYDTDFTYLYDTLGWAPDAQAQEGKYSAIYYYGSGTCAGGAKEDTTGGWQTYVAGYTAVAASFYPLYSFNTSCPYRDRVSQMDAMIHEGIHSMTNGYPGAKQAHWFQEAGNTWIQQDMFSHREGVYSGMGFLNAATVIAPFMPIECYSGWLVDGTFGGPGAQGVTGKNQRYLLGGSQYSNIFPTFMGTWLGTGSVRWIYGNAYGKTTYLLETYALEKGLGPDATRRLITEFRARMALLDMKKWSNEIKNLLNNNFGGTSYEEQYYWDNGQYRNTWKMTPYQTMTASGEYLVPDEATTPGWSGSNVIPLKVSSGAKQVTVSFYNVGDKSNNTNMNYLLCYRATDGTPVYSEPITGEGAVTLRLDKTPSSTNGTQMVFAVVVNTDYQYTGNENIRTNHYNYKIKLEEGLSGAGDANTKYYNNFVLDYEWPEIGENTFSSSSEAVSGSSSSSSSNIIAADTVEFEISATVQISEDYGTTSVEFDSQKLATALGISANELASTTFFAIDGNTFNTTSTAKAPGHWFDKNGLVTEWGENAYVFAEWNLTDGKIAIGHYPNRVSAGETYKLAQGFKTGNKIVIYRFTIKIANDSEPGEPSEGTTSIAFKNQGPAKYTSLKNHHGVLEIHYTINRQDNVKISLYSAYGKLLYQNISGVKPAGQYREKVDLVKSGLPQGTYIVKVSTGSYREIQSINMIQ